MYKESDLVITEYHAPFNEHLRVVVNLRNDTDDSERFHASFRDRLGYYVKGFGEFGSEPVIAANALMDKYMNSFEEEPLWPSDD